MANTIDSLGDIETFEAFISGQLTDYTDDDLIVLNSNFNWGYTSVMTLNLINVTRIIKGSASNSYSSPLLSINLPKLEYANRDFPGSTTNVSQLNFPKLKVITSGFNNAINDNTQIVNYPKVLISAEELTIPEYASVFSIENLRAVKSIYLQTINGGATLTKLRFPKLQYLFGQSNPFNSGTSDTDHPSAYSYNPDALYSIYGSSLELVDFQCEDFKFLNGAYFGGRAQYQRNSGTLRVILRSTNIPTLRSTKRPSLSNNFKVYFYVPFFMLNKYQNHSQWSHENYISLLRSIETITNQSNHTITPDEISIPYYQDTVSYTCSMTADYTDNTNGSTISSEELSYHMRQNIGSNLSSNQIVKTVSEVYGSETLSFQVTQSGIDFNSGYSVGGLRTYGWKEYSDPDFLTGYQYFEASKSLYETGYLEDGLYLDYETPGTSEILAQAKEITIFINGLTHFDFYIIDDTSYSETITLRSGEQSSYQTYINSTGDSWMGYAHHLYTYIGNLDDADIDSNYKVRYDSNRYNRDSTIGSSYELLGYKWYEYDERNHSYTLGHVTKKDVSDSRTYWKHIEYDNIDPSTPHFIKLRSEINTQLDHRRKDYHYQKFFIAIPDSYTYHSIPMVTEDSDE